MPSTIWYIRRAVAFCGLESSAASDVYKRQDQNHGPVVGGCDTCRGLVTIDLSIPEKPVVKPELDYYVLGQASKFLLPGAVRIASDEPAGTKLKDVAFRNRNGTVVLYTLNEGGASQELRIGFHGKMVATTLPAGAVATFVWRP